MPLITSPPSNLAPVKPTQTHVPNIQQRILDIYIPDLRIFLTSTSVSCILNNVQILDEKQKKNLDK